MREGESYQDQDGWECAYPNFDNAEVEVSFYVSGRVEVKVHYEEPLPLLYRYFCAVFAFNEFFFGSFDEL